MISDLWTLHAADDPGDESPLSEWGVVGATLVFRSLAADTLRLQVAAAESIDAADLWAWDTPLVLRRGSEVFFRGRVATTGRSGAGASEGMVIEIRNAWWDLERTTHLSPWATAGSVPEQLLGRYVLGRSIDGERATTDEAITDAIAYAVSAGVAVGYDGSALPALYPPEQSAHNRTVADLIRAAMRWHPDATLAAVYDESGTLLRAIPRAEAAAQILTIGQAPLESCHIWGRPDLVPDATHVLYETAAPQYLEPTVGLPTRSATRLVVARDTWPVGEPITRRSLVVTLPGPALPGGGGASPTVPPQPHRHPVQTRPIPQPGATDAAAQRWWLDHSELGDLGLTTGDIRLPSSSTDEVLAHQVAFASDPPPESMPSAINPAATVLSRPPSPSDLPRELVAGSVAEWMPGVQWARLVARATIAVRKSTVDGLPEASRALFSRLAPREADVQGVEAYLVDVQAPIMGTNATTRVYLQWPESGGAASDAGVANAAAVAEATADAIVPDLARRLQEARSSLPYEGSISLLEAEAGAQRWLGRVVNLAGGRPEWLSARALVQGESLDLATGATRLEVGPPEHLAAQDWAELHLAARAAQDARALSAGSPRDRSGAMAPTTPDPDDAETSSSSPGGGVFGAAAYPVSGVTFLSGGSPSAPERWDLVPTSSPGQYEVFAPAILAAAAAVDEMLSVSGSPFTPAAGEWLVARIDSLTTLAVTLEQSSSWSGFPSPHEFSGGEWAASRLPIWRFHSAAGAGRVRVGDVWGEQLVRRGSVLRVAGVLRLVPGGGQVRTVPELL